MEPVEISQPVGLGKGDLPESAQLGKKRVQAAIHLHSVGVRSRGCCLLRGLRRLFSGFSRLGLGLGSLFSLLAGSDEGSGDQGEAQEDVFHRDFTVTFAGTNAKNEIQPFSTPAAAARMADCRSAIAAASSGSWSSQPAKCSRPCTA